MNDERRLAALCLSIIQNKPVDALWYCRHMLRKVSRTFALTIRMLGFPVRDPVLIGYLLCRIADTYEDAPDLSPDQKIELLEDFHNLVKSDGADAIRMARLKCTPLINAQAGYEEFLTKHPDIVFEACSRLPSRTRAIIRETVLEMTAGMMETIGRYGAGTREGVDNEKDLNRYCYYVAGTVGHMLTDLFKEYSPWISKKRYRKLCIDKEAFGAGLQLTNIIKDAVTDLHRSVSYIPRDLAAKYAVSPADIHLPQFRNSARKIMSELIVKAVSNLNFALRYTILIPKTEPRMRLFCLLPIFLAIRTLLRAASDDVLFSTTSQIKISRTEVRQTVRRVFLMCLWDFLVVREYSRLLRQIENRLGVTIPLHLRTLKFLPIAKA